MALNWSSFSSSVIRETKSAARTLNGSDVSRYASGLSTAAARGVEPTRLWAAGAAADAPPVTPATTRSAAAVTTTAVIHSGRRELRVMHPPRGVGRSSGRKAREPTPRQPDNLD